MLCRAAGLAAVLLTATTASSIAGSGEAVSVRAKLSTGADAPLLQIDGTQDAPKRDRFKITGSLRGLPCLGKTFRLVISSNVAAVPVYDATLVFRKSEGDRIPCGVRLPRDLGSRLRMQIYREGATPGDSSIIVEGRRRGATAIKGLFTTRDLLCGDAYRLRVQVSAPGRQTSIVYEVSMKKVIIHGRSCRG
jgi:hypothetical protein